MDELVKVYEAEGRGRVWLQDVLEDNCIPYEAVPDFYWTGGKAAGYHDKVCIYVAMQHREMALGFIDEYNNEDNIAWEDIDWDSDGGIPQIICTACGQEFDFDYPKCPSCSHPAR